MFPCDVNSRITLLTSVMNNTQQCWLYWSCCTLQPLYFLSYNWKFAPFDSLHPIPPSLVTSNQISFSRSFSVWFLKCNWPTTLNTSQWFSTFIHYRVITIALALKQGIHSTKARRTFNQTNYKKNSKRTPWLYHIREAECQARVHLRS